ncbi:MAG TPA: radical SAM protein [Anaerolineae bacterium]|nr:radical SAM protein [Anaerolineae bacterium]
MYAFDEVTADADNFRLTVLNGQPYRPLYVKLKLVWDCNLKCGMCNHWRRRERLALSDEQLHQLVLDLAEWGCRKIHITGGEPTLYPQLPTLINHMSNHNIRVNMTTNATLIDRDNSRALASAGLRAVNVSIDSPNRKIHDQIRGLNGAWKKTYKGTRYLRKRLKKGKLRINTVVGQLNYASLVDLPDLALDLGADGLNLIPLDEHTPDLHRLSKRQIRHYNQEIAPIIAQKALAHGLIKHENDAYPFGRTPDEIRRSKAGHYAQGYYNDNPCFAPWTHALIDHLGRVSLCCMLRGQPILGDLRHQTFTEIWTGAHYANLRRTTDLPLFNACRQCDDFLTENQQFNQILNNHHE